MRVESEEMLRWTVQRAWSLFVFSVSLAFFQHPQLSYHLCEGTGCGREDDSNVCGSVSWRLLNVATWKLAARGEDCGGASDSQVESGGKKTILSLILTVHTVCQAEWDRQCLY
ncbi:hypothetical protein ABVT39_003531 [Epinephelus coioides]